MWGRRGTDRKREGPHSLHKSLKIFLVKKNFDHFCPFLAISHPLNENSDYFLGGPEQMTVAGATAPRVFFLFIQIIFIFPRRSLRLMIKVIIFMMNIIY